MTAGREILKRFLRELPISQSFSRAAEALALRELAMKKPILDLGCGDGLFAEVLFEGEREAVEVGLDISPSEVSLASKRAVYKEIKVADAANLPYPNESFATVLCNSSLEHMRDLDKVLLEVNQVLKKGGKFVFIVPHPGTEDFFLTSLIFQKIGLTSLAKLAAELRHRLVRHHNVFGVDVWREKLKKSGLVLREYHYEGGEKNWLMVELFLPLWLIGALLKKITGRWVLPPRSAVASLVPAFFGRFLPQKPFCSKGPGLLVVAVKEGL